MGRCISRWVLRYPVWAVCRWHQRIQLGLSIWIVPGVTLVGFKVLMIICGLKWLGLDD